MSIQAVLVWWQSGPTSIWTVVGHSSYWVVQAHMIIYWAVMAWPDLPALTSADEISKSY